MSFKRKAKRSKKPRVISIPLTGTDEEREALELFDYVVGRYKQALKARLKCKRDSILCEQIIGKIHTDFKTLGYSESHIRGIQSALMSEIESESDD